MGATSNATWFIDEIADTGPSGPGFTCFVGYARDGRISRAYEYFDTGRIDEFLGPRQ